MLKKLHVKARLKCSKPGIETLNNWFGGRTAEQSSAFSKAVDYCQELVVHNFKCHLSVMVKSPELLKPRRPARPETLLPNCRRRATARIGSMPKD
jgi:hypothetical protein